MADGPGVASVVYDHLARHYEEFDEEPPPYQA
jgi:hypothetical protein